VTVADSLASATPSRALTNCFPSALARPSARSPSSVTWKCRCSPGVPRDTSNPSATRRSSARKRSRKTSPLLGCARNAFGSALAGEQAGCSQKLNVVLLQRRSIPTVTV